MFLFSQCLGEEPKCQICDSIAHLSLDCPFMYTQCKASKCHGIRKIMLSTTEKNPNRSFLKYQSSGCGGSFQWLDDAILESRGVVGCSATQPKQHRLDSCEGKRVVKISKWVGYEGDKYLGCTNVKTHSG
ncbi:hypothetical protein BVC80_8901g19 [Macleaya cordata]|uniref:Zinc finger protein n=1 Tax=Macleaya cordata TaxID=56857 RepID=A0A200RDT6_MACCD|nr:hypothetical protein BVC80_8901g19 [Macleaya cordata]